MAPVYPVFFDGYQPPGGADRPPFWFIICFMMRCFIVPFLVAALGVAACNAFSEDPETRARGYVETYVLDPANTTKLNELANTQADPRVLAAGLGPGMAADYLRARRDQGATLNFSTTRVERPDALHRTVTVLVRADSDSHATDEVAFEVMLVRSDGAWHIAQVRGGG
jgi:hypothetical protein